MKCAKKSWRMSEFASTKTQIDCASIPLVAYTEWAQSTSLTERKSECLSFSLRLPCKWLDSFRKNEAFREANRQLWLKAIVTSHSAFNNRNWIERCGIESILMPIKKFFFSEKHLQSFFLWKSTQIEFQSNIINYDVNLKTWEGEHHYQHNLHRSRNWIWIESKIRRRSGGVCQQWYGGGWLRGGEEGKGGS